ncbi:MAG: hypothetical protein NVS9B15_00990 [Acidobacteriaceae bacterium]
MVRISLVASTFALAVSATVQQAALPAAGRALARGVFQQLIETNTAHSTGSTGVAAEAIQKRMMAAEFPAEDVQILGPDTRHDNLVVRYRGARGSNKKPV